MSHADFLRHWLKLVWIENDFRKGESYFDKGKAIVQVSGGMIEVQEYETIIGSICTRIRPYDVVLENVIEQGDVVSAVAIIKSRRVGDAKPVDVETFQFRRIRDGKFVESRVCLNFIALYSDLGQLPEDTLPTLLMGESLVEH